MKYLFMTAALMAVQDAPADAAYLPLKVGSAWEYKVKDDERSLVRKIVGRDEDGTWRQEELINGKTERKDSLRMEKDGLKWKAVTLGDAEVVFSTPVILLRFPAKKDDTWTQEVELSGNKATVKAVTIEEKVKVPAGEYTALKAVLTVTAEVGDQKTIVTLAAWYVKDVGVVKHSLKATAADAELMSHEGELTKYTPAKEEKKEVQREK